MNSLKPRINYILTPQAFLRFIKTEQNRPAIVRSRFVAPTLGSKGFGHVMISLKYEPKNTHEPKHRQSIWR